ncbi:MAG TPA: type II toxin-antitoxin system RelE/ParE family toxin [Azospirillum sp.]
MARLSFAERALTDLDDIGLHIAEHDPQVALRFIDGIEEKCRLLAAQPGIGRDRGELRPHMRSHVHGRYVIFYRPLPGGIEVLRVLHGSRDIGSALTE